MNRIARGSDLRDTVVPSVQALPVSTADRWNRPAALVGMVIVLALIIWMSRWVGPGSQPVTVDVFLTLTQSLPLPMLWLASAVGLGWPMRRLIARGTSHPIALQTALGVATMFFADASLGAMGLLTSRAIAWLMIAIGAGLLLAQLTLAGRLRIASALPDWPAWSCAPAVAVLLIAACSAPGWLWSSEFGGYDALSYHLQLPKEWLALGAIEPLQHNVYSFLPGYVEAAYLHLLSLRGEAHAMNALYDCQMLHALLTLAAAAMTGAMTSCIVQRIFLAAHSLNRAGEHEPHTGDTADSLRSLAVAPATLGAMAGALYLATPWTIIVGSLAYNEMAVNLMLAAGVLIAFDLGISPVRRGALIGIFSAAAVGAKLTSLGFVAAPLGLLLLLSSPVRTWLTLLASAAIVGAIGLFPYLLRNGMYSGNPLFPFATSMFGPAHWNAEQVLAWHRGHLPDASISQRLLAAWRQLFMFGIGTNPKPGEPWLVQWSALPWLGVIGGCLGVMRLTLRREAFGLIAVFIAQITFWLAFTHLQSRFLVPTAVPLCALAAIGITTLFANGSDQTTLVVSRLITPLLTFVILILALQPMRIYHAERNGSPALAIGTVAQQTGDTLDNAGRSDLGSVYPPIAVNWLLPRDARVLFVGEAAPLYFDLDRITYNTVWDRGPLSDIMREYGNDGEAICAALRSQGYTHVLLNPTMLSIWERDRWNDPFITRQNVLEAFESSAEPIFDFPAPSEITIYALPE